jgi:hypothetical protein
MKKVFIPGIVSSIALFAFSYVILLVSIRFFPYLIEEYYNPVFWPGSERSVLFYLHPVVLSFGLAWLWHRIKGIFKGSWYFRGLEFGVVYALVATLPAMWVCFSTLDVTLFMVLSWLIYGWTQASIAGLIFSRLNP